MASSRGYLEYILEQLSGLDEITYRSMMGEYIIYYRGRIAGGIYDDRLLVKPVDAASSYLREVQYQAPYEGAKDMILVDDTDNSDYLCGLFETIHEQLPAPKPKKKNRKA